MALEPIGASLRAYLEKTGLSSKLRGWDAIHLWPDVVGTNASARSRAVAFDSGRLIIEVDGAVWMAQLSYLRRDILRRLNARLGGQIVQDIQFTPSRGQRT